MDTHICRTSPPSVAFHILRSFTRAWWPPPPPPRSVSSVTLSTAQKEACAPPSASSVSGSVKLGTWPDYGCHSCLKWIRTVGGIWLPFFCVCVWLWQMDNKKQIRFVYFEINLMLLFLLEFSWCVVCETGRVVALSILPKPIGRNSEHALTLNLDD